MSWFQHKTKSYTHRTCIKDMEMYQMVSEALLGKKQQPTKKFRAPQLLKDIRYELLSLEISHVRVLEAVRDCQTHLCQILARVAEAAQILKAVESLGFVFHRGRHSDSQLEALKSKLCRQKAFCKKIHQHNMISILKSLYAEDTRIKCQLQLQNSKDLANTDSEKQFPKNGQNLKF